MVLNTLHVTTRAAWRQWLQENHDSIAEIWLIYHKKHTGKPRIPYEDAVEEAICFGWIDSIVKKIDEEKYMQKFTPRKNLNNWSELNITRAKKMIKQGGMTRFGLRKIPEHFLKRDRVTTSKPASKPVSLSPNLEKVLHTNEKALENFKRMTPSQQRLYKGWIMSAKKEETRERRLKEAIELLAQNKKLGLK